MKGNEFTIKDGVLEYYTVSPGETSITLPAGVTSIGEAAFCGCVALTSIELPEGVTSIARDAFYRCKALTSIELPADVTSIGEFAFMCCYSLHQSHCQRV